MYHESLFGTNHHVRGEENIPRNLKLFRPTLIQYILFWKQDPNATFKNIGFDIKARDMDKANIKDVEVVEERDYIIIQLQMDLKEGQNRFVNGGWVELTHNDFKNAFDLGKKLVTKRFKKNKDYQNKLKLIGSYQLLVCGSEKDYWTKAKIDFRKFKIDADGIERSLRLRDIEAESNLMHINNSLFSGKRIRGDVIKNLKLPTTIYALGNDVDDEFHQLPHTFLMNIVIETKALDKDTIELQNKQFQVAINGIISNFGKLLMHVAKLIDLYKDEYITTNQKSNEIRDKALKLQIKINDILVKKSEKSVSTASELVPTPGTKKEKKGRNREKKTNNSNYENDENQFYRGWEENLLIKASQYFSLLTEMNQIIARANYLRQEAAVNLDKMTNTLGFTPITMLGETDKEMASFGLDLKQFSETIDYNFQNLKLELDHSQSTIRNTVDILKTFLESEQRIVSQKSSEAINWIVIVFAGLGLADALGNFVIFVLEGGSVFQAMYWFSIIMMVLFCVIIVLYFVFFKTPRYLKN